MSKEDGLYTKEEILQMIESSFKERLTELMLKNPSKNPSYEDGFYDGIKIASILTGEVGAVCMEVSADALAGKSFLEGFQSLGMAVSSITKFSLDLHNAAHVHVTGNKDMSCSAVKALEKQIVKATVAATISILKQSLNKKGKPAPPDPKTVN